MFNCMAAERIVEGLFEVKQLEWSSSSSLLSLIQNVLLEVKQFGNTDQRCEMDVISQCFYLQLVVCSGGGGGDRTRLIAVITASAVPRWWWEASAVSTEEE